MAKLNRENIRERLQQHLRPGEQLLQVGYGVEPLSPLMFIFLTIVTLGVALPLATHLMRKHCLVGVTGSRLILLRLHALTSAPTGCTSHALNLLQHVHVTSGPIFVRIEFEDGSTRRTLKFHRGAFSGNREGALGIGKALEAGGAIPDPTGTTDSAAANEAATFVQPPKDEASAGRGTSWHMGLAMAALSVFVGLGFAVTLGSRISWTYLVMGAVVAGGAATALSALGIPRSPVFRGAIAGGLSCLGERIIGFIAYFVLGGYGDLVSAVERTLPIVLNPSAMTFVVTVIYAFVGAAVSSWSERPARAPGR
jgi:hypothetical protein